MTYRWRIVNFITVHHNSLEKALDDVNVCYDDKGVQCDIDQCNSKSLGKSLDDRVNANTKTIQVYDDELRCALN